MRPVAPVPAARRVAALAAPLLLLHVALILFSTAAMVTILAGPPPAWLLEGINGTVYRWAWRLSGPTYVVLGALAALAHATGRIGAGRALLIFLLGSLISLGSELLGTSTGFPFGEYTYTPLLGYRIAGLVPFPIPVSWFYMLYGSLAIVGRLLPAGDGVRTRALWALVGGLVLTAWDVAMDPAMVATAHWVWGVQGPFYGMPWSNWFGWVLTGTVVSFVMLLVVPPTQWRARIATTTLPIVLYLVNGVMPVALCVRDGLWGAAVLGTLAMLVPAALALRAGAPHGAVAPVAPRLDRRADAGVALSGD